MGVWGSGHGIVVLDFNTMILLDVDSPISEYVF